MDYVDFNGVLKPSEEAHLSVQNRGYQYGDAVFETIKVLNSVILFWEDHYLRLMASMRIMRMEIPMNFTMEFLEERALALIDKNLLNQKNVRLKIVVHRKTGGFYTPKHSEVEYIIFAQKIRSDMGKAASDSYEVGLYKDYYIAPDLLSTLKSNNKLLHILGSVFAKENGFANCLLLNTHKMVVESLNANVFLVKDNKIKTPPLSDGCLNGVMRLQIFKILKNTDYTIEEASISPFELQKADEIFLTNSISGIIPVTHYKKKSYANKIVFDLQKRLQQEIKKIELMAT